MSNDKYIRVSNVNSERDTLMNSLHFSPSPSSSYLMKEYRGASQILSGFLFVLKMPLLEDFIILHHTLIASLGSLMEARVRN